MKFATETQIKINQLLDGEPVKTYLPNLNGTENTSEILKQLELRFAHDEKVGQEEARAHRLNPDSF